MRGRREKSESKYQLFYLGKRVNFSSNASLLLIIFSSLMLTNNLQTREKEVLTQEQVFYNEIIVQWEKEIEELQRHNQTPRGRHNIKPLQEFLNRYPQSEFSDVVFLMLAEEARCQDWHGYPDCGIIEVRLYEEFLSRFPRSNLREEVELKRAEAYYQMAFLWLYGEGRADERWADLFRAQSWKIVQALKDSKTSEVREGVEQLEKKLEKNFPRPIAPVSSRVLDPNYL